jgi:hypothetical protein
MGAGDRDSGSAQAEDGDEKRVDEERATIEGMPLRIST